MVNISHFKVFFKTHFGEKYIYIFRSYYFGLLHDEKANLIASGANNYGP